MAHTLQEAQLLLNYFVVSGQLSFWIVHQSEENWGFVLAESSQYILCTNMCSLVGLQSPKTSLMRFTILTTQSTTSQHSDTAFSQEAK